jgi:hypothetical protein
MNSRTGPCALVSASSVEILLSISGCIASLPTRVKTG